MPSAATGGHSMHQCRLKSWFERFDAAPPGVDSSASGVSAIFPGILPSLPLMSGTYSRKVGRSPHVSSRCLRPEAPSSRVEPPQLLVRHSGGTMEDRCPALSRAAGFIISWHMLSGRLGDAAYGKLLARMGHHASLS